MSTFSYYELSIRLKNPMLGTNPSSADILKEHIIEKARKEIVAANKGQQKILKSLKKYLGSTITPAKELEELSGIIRGQQELLGVREEIPDTVEGIIAYSEELDKRLSEKFENNNEEYKATVFLRNSDGKACVSTHMFLGFIKSVLTTVTNSQKAEEKKSGIFKSKTQLSECMSLDVKFLETLVESSKDILYKEDGTRDLCIRSIRFNRMGQTVTALCASEQLPEGSILKTVMRVRKGSPVDSLDILQTIFDHGKNTGLGAWRGSSNHGQFHYKIVQLPDFIEHVEGADEGWR